MATINPTLTWSGDMNSRKVRYETLTTTNDAGASLDFQDFADRSVQVAGTFGVGGTLVIQGSNDGSNWRTLTDPQGNALSFTAGGIEQIMEITFFMRPLVTAGDGTTDLDVTFLLRRG